MQNDEFFLFLPLYYSVAMMKRDFFEMTRHERRGAIVILAIIALLLAVTCVSRCHRPTYIMHETEEVMQFEAEVDSSTVEVAKPSPKQRKGKRRKSAAKPSKPPKPAPSPRRMDPVPQF